MRCKILVCFCLFLIHHTAVESKNCNDEDISTLCDTTNYEQYVACIRKRSKRSADCDADCTGDNCVDSCNSCDCDSCGSDSCERSSCDNSCCSSCCQYGGGSYNFNNCRTNHCCHKMCHAECRTTNCRRGCRKSCQKIVYQTNDSNSNTESKPSSNETSSSSSQLHNVTTIIHLKNNINHTYVIDVPINLNYTNQNNVSLSQIEQNFEEEKIVGGGGGNSTSTTDEKCCILIGPKECSPSKEYPFYPKCFRKRSKQCGSFCTAEIMHEERRQICTQIAVGEQTECQQQNIYIPQPQPRCVYKEEWPYVSCGIKKSGACEGCYGQMGMQQFTGVKGNCHINCFDDGYGVGPYYRKGPFYQPGYSPYPPCQYVPGGCGDVSGMGNPYFPPVPYGVPQPIFPPYANGNNGIFSPDINFNPFMEPDSKVDKPGSEVEIDVDIETDKPPVSVPSN